MKLIVILGYETTSTETLDLTLPKEFSVVLISLQIARAEFCLIRLSELSNSMTIKTLTGCLAWFDRFSLNSVK